MKDKVITIIRIGDNNHWVTQEQLRLFCAKLDEAREQKKPLVVTFPVEVFTVNEANGRVGVVRSKPGGEVKI